MMQQANVTSQGFLQLCKQGEVKNVFCSTGQGGVPQFEALVPFRPEPLKIFTDFSIYKEDRILGRKLDQFGNTSWKLNSHSVLQIDIGSKVDLVRMLTDLQADPEAMAKIKLIKAGELKEVIDSTQVEADAEGTLQELTIKIKETSDRFKIKTKHKLVPIVHLAANRGSYNSSLVYTLSAPFADRLQDASIAFQNQLIAELKVTLIDGYFGR